MTERSERVGIDRAELGEVERFEDGSLYRLQRPFGEVVGAHCQENRLRSACGGIVVMEGDPGDLLPIRQHLDPVVDYQPGYAVPAVTGTGEKATSDSRLDGAAAPARSRASQRSPAAKGSCATSKWASERPARASA